MIDTARDGRLSRIDARLAAAVEKNPIAPEWSIALFLLSGIHLRMMELNCSSEQMDASVAALFERALDGGPPL